MGRARLILIFCLFIIVGLFIYKDTLKNQLFWDDEFTILNNVFIKDFKFLKEIFTTGYHEGAGEITSLYRPLAILSFLIEYKFWGLNSFHYHLTNIALHIFNSIILLLLLNNIFKKESFSLIVSFLYLIHPQATEVVNYASHRPELLMTLFFLMSLNYYVKFTQGDNKLYLLFSIIFYFLSILSKEMGMVLILFVYLYNIFSAQKKYNKPALLFFVPLILYLFVRATYLNFLNISLLYGPQLQAYSESITERLLIFSKIFFVYLKILFFPVNLHMERDIPYLAEPFDYRAFFSAGLIIIFLTYLIISRKKNPALFFGGFWFILCLLPVSGIIAINTAIAEHYIYLASIGFFIIIASLGIKAYRKIVPGRRPSRAGFFAVWIFFGIITSALAALTIKRNMEWNEPIILYLTTVDNARQSFRANNNVGVEYFRKGDMDKAGYYFRRSLDILPTYAPALNNMGVILQRQGRIEEAMQYYKNAKENNPRYLLAYKNLAQIYIKSGREKEAREELREVLKYFPFDEEAKAALLSISD